MKIIKDYNYSHYENRIMPVLYLQAELELVYLYYPLYVGIILLTSVYISYMLITVNNYIVIINKIIMIPIVDTLHNCKILLLDLYTV